MSRAGAVPGAPEARRGPPAGRKSLKNPGPDSSFYPPQGTQPVLARPARESHHRAQRTSRGHCRPGSSSAVLVSQRDPEVLLLAKWSALFVAGFWKLLKIYIFYSGPDLRNPQNRPGKAAPDPPNIVEQPWDIIDFQSRGGGPAGHP